MKGGNHDKQPTQAAPSVFKSEQAAAEVHARYQELLRLWPVPNEQLYIPTRQGQTRSSSSAGLQDAPPLVLLHGTMANAAAWMREVGHLSPSSSASMQLTLSVMQD